MLRRGRCRVVVLVLVTGWLFGLSLRAADSRQVVGMVLASPGVTLGEVTVPRAATIFAGDLLKTPKGGSALVKFSPITQFDIAENTSVHFGLAGRSPLALLSLGTISTTTESKEGLVVETPKYRIEPAERGKAVHEVAVLANEATVVAARRGGVSITEISSGQRYVLPEGKYATIAASSAGVPGAGSSSGGGWHIGSLSHRVSIGVVVAAAAGVTAAIVIPLATGSPSAP